MVIPDAVHERQIAVEVLMLPIQFIFRGSKFAPLIPYKGAKGTLECTRPMTVPSRAATVDSFAQCIDHPPDQRFAHRDFGDTAGAFDGIAFSDHVSLAEQGGADIVFFQVKRQAEYIMRELD